MRAVVVGIASVASLAALGGTAFAAWELTGAGTGAGTAVQLGAPGKPVSTASTSTSASLSWTASAAPAGAAVRYWVQRVTSTGATFTDACASTEQSGLSSLSCTDTGLTAGTSYTYRVTAVLGAWRAVGTLSDAVSTPGGNTASSPAAGATGVSRTGPFTGSTGSTATVTLTFYVGTTATGSPSRIWTGTPVNGTWSVKNENQGSNSGSDLAANTTYTVVISQAGSPDITRTFTTGAS